MDRSKKSGKTRMTKGAAQFLWAELKTLNSEKIRSLYKIASGYMTMKMSDSKDKESKTERYKVV